MDIPESRHVDCKFYHLGEISHVLVIEERSEHNRKRLTSWSYYTILQGCCLEGKWDLPQDEEQM